MHTIKNKNTGSADGASCRRILRYAAGWFVALMTFLLPVKFGSLAVMPEAAGFFPPDVFSWIIINWPAHSFGVFSGIALLLCLVSFPLPDFFTARGITALLWGIGLPVAALCGAVNSRAVFYSDGEIAHILSCSAYCLAVYLLLAGSDDIWRRRLSSALTCGVLLLCISGLRQYFFGFAEMQEFIAKQQQQGIRISSVMLAKVADNRVYALMVSANVLAGFLLLTVPFTVVCFRKAGTHFEPVKFSQRLFMSFAVTICVAVLLMTKTRAAFLCALVTAAVMVFTFNFSRVWKSVLLAVFLLTVAGSACYIKIAGRGFGSLAERADYMRTVMKMLPEKPLAGHGWGGFFYRHMKEKTTPSDESAHDPHHIFLSFASQCGIPAGVLVCACFLFPLILIWKKRKTAEDDAVFWGSFAFALHCCCDINMQVPACLAGQGLLFLLAVPDEKFTAKTPALPLKILLYMLFAAVAVSSTALNRSCLRGEIAFSQFYDALHMPPGKAPGEEQIIRLWQNVENIRKGHPFACIMLGDHYLASGNIYRAKQLFTEALKRDPGRPAVYRRLAHIAETEGDLKSRDELLDRARELFPSHPDSKLDKKAPAYYINGYGQ